MSGYCATGSVKSAMKPPSVMTIDSTEAKIGRPMKNLENTEKTSADYANHYSTPFAPRPQAPLGDAGREAPLRRSTADWTTHRGRLLEAELRDLRAQAELGH